MPLDTLILDAVAKELQTVITGSSVQKVYEPSRKVIILNLYSQGQQHYLLLSFDAHYGRVHLTETRLKMKPSKEQPSPFCMLLRKYLIGGKVSSQVKNAKPDAGNPLGRVLMVAEEQGTADTETLELKLGEAIFREMPRLTRSLLFIKIISVVAPLLGLLGTVTGMIVTFQAITLFGTGDPKLMAGGISQALVTTVLGLTVAIPIVLLHTLVSGRSRHLMHILQEQSAGIVAARSGETSQGKVS